MFPSSPSDNRSGFSLIVVMSLMAFVLLLMLSLSSLISLELNLSGAQKVNVEARQNALFGLQTALGELQRTLGPDQRVTAQAAIYDSNPSTSAAEGVANPEWLGVFKTVQPGNERQGLESLRIWSEDFTSAGRVDWLVSSRTPLNNGTLNPIITDVVTLNGSEDNIVTLATYVDDNGAAMPVQAGKIDMTDSGGVNTGHYGWWITDESAKFRTNAVKPDTVLDAQPFESQWSLMVPHRSNLAVIPELASFDSQDAEQQNQLQRTLMQDHLALVDDTWETWVDGHANAITFTSRSVPVDVTQGRLKEDLSVYLGSNNSGLADDTYVVRGSASDTGYLGRLGNGAFQLNYLDDLIPQFGLIKDWYQAGMALSGLAGGVPLQTRAHQVDQHGFHPVILRTAVYFSPSFKVEADGTVRLAFLIYPKFVLWNPYNAPLAPARYILQVRAFTTLNTQISNAGNDYAAYNRTKDFYYQGNDPNATANSSFGHFNLGNPAIPESPERDPDDDYPYFTFVIESEGFAPGETLLYTAAPKHPNSAYVDGTIEDFENISSTAFNNHNKLENENHSVAGFFYLVARGIMQPLPGASGQPSITDAGDILDAAFYFRDTVTDSPAGAGVREPSMTTKLYHLTDGGDVNLIQFLDFKGEDEDKGTRLDWEDAERAGTGQVSHGNNSPLHPDNIAEFKSLTTVTPPPTAPYAEPKHHWGHGYFMAPVGFPSGASKIRLFARTNPFVSQVTVTDPLLSISRPGQGRIYLDGRPQKGWFSGTGFPQDIPGEGAYSGLSIDGYDTLGGFGIYRNNGSTNHSTVYPLYNLPRAETGLLSIGFLKNVNFGQRDWHPTFPFGGSEAHTHINRNAVQEIHGGTRYIDLSYLLNESFWDRFYLSSIPQTGAFSIGEDTVLPNTRLRLVPNPDGSWPADADLRDSQTAFQQSAANVFVEGGFNVNSTSVEAWKLFLASYLGESVTTASGQASNAPDRNPLGGHLYPLLRENTADIIDTPETWSSVRTLDNAEIDQLARAIVAEIKRRGPFLSLADFVNRRLVPNADNEDGDWLGLKGTLQAALDRASIADGGLNDYFYTSTAGFTAAEALLNPNYPEHETGSPGGLPGTLMYGTPNFLSQADLLEAFGTHLTVRGDTFVIRAYGDTINPLTNEIKAQAWCEAVVQRTAEPVAAGDSIVQPTGAFGRRFEIVAFRWLSPEDVL